MSTNIRETLAGSRRSRVQVFAGTRLAQVAIRLLVSVNLLYAAIFLKFVGVPGSVALFTQMSQAVHGLISQPVFRLGSGAFETVVAILLLIPKTARWGARFTAVWMTAVILSHIFVLGYGWFFVDALVLMLLAVIYLLLTRSSVTAEVASSSLVVPAIHSKRVERISMKPTRVQKGAFLHPFCTPFRQLEPFSGGRSSGFDSVYASALGVVSEPNTRASTAA
jgi:hypothetical protein